MGTTKSNVSSGFRKLLYVKLGLECLSINVRKETQMTLNNTKEIIFLVEEDPEGGYTATALGESIITQADDMKTLKEMIKDAITCHYDDPKNYPTIIRLHIVRDEVFAL